MIQVLEQDFIGILLLNLINILKQEPEGMLIGADGIG